MIIIFSSLIRHLSANIPTHVTPLEVYNCARNRKQFIKKSLLEIPSRQLIIHIQFSSRCFNAKWAAMCAQALTKKLKNYMCRVGWSPQIFSKPTPSFFPTCNCCCQNGYKEERERDRKRLKWRHLFITYFLPN